MPDNSSHVKVRTPPAPDILNPARSDHTGDVTTSGELPIVAPKATHEVQVNLSLARRPEGARCIHITGPSSFTYAEAEQVLADLRAAVTPIKELRTMGGFDD